MVLPVRNSSPFVVESARDPSDGEEERIRQIIADGAIYVPGEGVKKNLQEFSFGPKPSESEAAWMQRLAEEGVLHPIPAENEDARGKETDCGKNSVGSMESSEERSICREDQE